jgi:hypothetical protein
MLYNDALLPQTKKFDGPPIPEKQTIHWNVV